MEYTKDSLLKFKGEMAQKAIDAKTGGDGGGMFGFGGGAGGGGGGGTSDKVSGGNNLEYLFRYLRYRIIPIKRPGHLCKSF